MTKQLKSYNEKSKDKIKIFAYGFDAAGFETPQEPIKLNNICIIEFIGLNDTLRLDGTDGVITLQGIFEKIKTHPTTIGDHTTIDVNKELLLEREKQVINLLEKDKWICFLVGKIVDSFYSGFPPSLEIVNDTDLCKKLLNIFNVKRNTVDGISLLNATENEFISYVREYGIAKTVLNLPSELYNKSNVIAKAGNRIVGVEFLNKVFFLPFHTTKKQIDDVIPIVKTVAKAILDYRQKHIIEVPDWVDEFQFSSEQKLISEISPLREKVVELEANMKHWKGYKAILVTSGEFLKNNIIKILEEFFELKIDPIDDVREDAKIIDEKGNVLAIIEIKGTKRGIKREHINQVDSHRERNELEISIPGILFINNEMSIKGIDKRLKTKVPNEHIKHAKNLNILIVRTIDLLFLMRHLENKPDKKDELVRIIESGGGWFKATPESYEIV